MRATRTGADMIAAGSALKELYAVPAKVPDTVQVRGSARVSKSTWPNPEQVARVRKAATVLRGVLESSDHEHIKRALAKLQSCVSKFRWDAATRREHIPLCAQPVVDVHHCLARVIRNIHPVPRDCAAASAELGAMLAALDLVRAEMQDLPSDQTSEHVPRPRAAPYWGVRASNVSEALQQLKLLEPELTMACTAWCEHVLGSSARDLKKTRAWHTTVLRVHFLKAMEQATERNARQPHAAARTGALPGKAFTLAPIISCARPFIRLNNNWVKQDLHAQRRTRLGIPVADTSYGILNLLRTKAAPPGVIWSTSAFGGGDMPTDLVPAVWKPGWKIPRSIYTDGVCVVLSWEHEYQSCKERGPQFLAQPGESSLAVQPDKVAKDTGQAIRDAASMARALAQVLRLEDELACKVERLARTAARQLPPGVAALASICALVQNHAEKQWCSVPCGGTRAWVCFGDYTVSNDHVPGVQRAIRAWCTRTKAGTHNSSQDWLTSRLWERVLQCAQAVRLTKPEDVSEWLDVAVDKGSASVSRVSELTHNVLVSGVCAGPVAGDEFVVAADPGEVNLITAVDGAGSSLLQYSKRNYYEDIGAVQARVKHPEKYASVPSWRDRVRFGWAPTEVLAAQAELALHSLSTTSTEAFERAVHARVLAQETVWQFYGHAWHAQCRFHRFKRKQRALQSLVERLAPRHPVTGERPLLLLGAGYAGRRSAQNGCALGPSGLIGVSEYLRKHMRVSYVSEYYTSQKCGVCYAHMTQLNMKGRTAGDGRAKSKRTAGKYCSDCGRAVARDLNAARNILQAGLAEMRGECRPAHLCRAPARDDSV